MGEPPSRQDVWEIIASIFEMRARMSLIGAFTKKTGALVFWLHVRMSLMAAVMKKMRARMTLMRALVF